MKLISVAGYIVVAFARSITCGRTGPKDWRGESSGMPSRLLLVMLSGLAWSADAASGQEAFEPLRAVVMIDSVTTSGNHLSGAGVVVGRDSDGQALIVTAHHVVHSPLAASSVSVRFRDNAAQAVPAEIDSREFGRNLDLALLHAPMPSALGSVLAAGLPIGRLSDDFVIEERASLVGQTDGANWSVTSGTQMITADDGDTVRVQSFDAGPGISGGAAFDGSRRIIGIALSDDRYVVKVLKLSVIAAQLQAAGLHFDILQGEKKDLLSEVELETVVKSALMSGHTSALSKVPTSARSVAMVDRLLDDGKLLASFAQRFGSEEDLRWVSELVDAGFDPNRLIDDTTGRRRSLIYAALRANNLKLATLLLKKGASPYVYEELVGQEYPEPYFLFPLEWLPDVSASDEDKADLVRAMIDAGLIAPQVGKPVDDSTGARVDGLAEAVADVRRAFGIEIPTQASVRKPPNEAMCGRLSRLDGHDWCAELRELPEHLQVTEDGWLHEFDSADLVALLNVVNGRMMVMTYSGWGGEANPGFGLMQVSKGSSTIVWYRYMGRAYGMGHCEELRGVANWQPHDYETCWKRQTMIRSSTDGQYHLQGLPNVRYRIP